MPTKNKIKRIKLIIFHCYFSIKISIWHFKDLVFNLLVLVFIFKIWHFFDQNLDLVFQGLGIFRFIHQIQLKNSTQSSSLHWYIVVLYITGYTNGENSTLTNQGFMCNNKSFIIRRSRRLKTILKIIFQCNHFHLLTPCTAAPLCNLSRILML